MDVEEEEADLNKSSHHLRHHHQEEEEALEALRRHPHPQEEVEAEATQPLLVLIVHRGVSATITGPLDHADGDLSVHIATRLQTGSLRFLSLTSHRPTTWTSFPWKALLSTTGLSDLKSKT